MAHDKRPNLITSIPIIGSPGVGYETALQRIADRGFATQKGDSFGSRSSEEKPEEWRYDALYVWRKMLQLSESGVITFVSFGGENAYEIALFPYPHIFYLDLKSTEEWVRRANAFRASVNLDPLSDQEIASHVRSAEHDLRYIKFVRDVCSVGSRIHVIEIDDMNPSEIADVILTECHL